VFSKDEVRDERCPQDNTVWPLQKLIESAANQAQSEGNEATCSEGQSVYNKSALAETP
jgi:hypothetical protein